MRRVEMYGDVSVDEGKMRDFSGGAVDLREGCLIVHADDAIVLATVCSTVGLV